MNVAESYMLRQMQQMAANMSGVPKTGGSGSKKDQTDSFQDMLDQTGKDTAVNDKENTSVGSQDGQDQKEPVQDTKGDAAEKPAGKPEKEPGKAQELHGDPNAMASVRSWTCRRRRPPLRPRRWRPWSRRVPLWRRLLRRLCRRSRWP